MMSSIFTRALRCACLTHVTTNLCAVSSMYMLPVQTEDHHVVRNEDELAPVIAQRLDRDRSARVAYDVWRVCTPGPPDPTDLAAACLAWHGGVVVVGLAGVFAGAGAV